MLGYLQKMVVELEFVCGVLFSLSLLQQRRYITRIVTPFIGLRINFPLVVRCITAQNKTCNNLKVFKMGPCRFSKGELNATFTRSFYNMGDKRPDFAIVGNHMECNTSLTAQ